MKVASHLLLNGSSQKQSNISLPRKSHHSEKHGEGTHSFLLLPSSDDHSLLSHLGSQCKENSRVVQTDVWPSFFPAIRHFQP